MVVLVTVSGANCSFGESHVIFNSRFLAVIYSSDFFGKVGFGCDAC